MFNSHCDGQSLALKSMKLLSTFCETNTKEFEKEFK